MTTYLLTTFDGDPDEGITRTLDTESAQDVLAEFFAHPDVSDGMGVIIRKADYMVPRVSPYSSYDAAVMFINSATSQEDRRKRKAQVFHIIYGNNALRGTYSGTITGRFTTHHPPLRLVPREETHG